jgi:GDP-mannose 6-dehydrogenase
VTISPKSGPTQLTNPNIYGPETFLQLLTFINSISVKVVDPDLHVLSGSLGHPSRKQPYKDTQHGGFNSGNMSSGISIFGLGYVGSVSAACFAHLGHQVTGVDVNPAKVQMLQSGKSPIIESGMNELVAEAHHCGRLRATTDAQAAIEESDVSFICVGTPGLRNGKLDLSHVTHVSREIGSALSQKKRYHTVVLRSTVLPGTTHATVVTEIARTSGLQPSRDFAVCYNPEFLREGNAISDFMDPPCTVLGSDDTRDVGKLREVYSGIASTRFETSICVAEMVKYASNAFHALKVTFANELGTLCKSLTVDTEDVTRIFKSDTRLNISSAYLSPGFAFGGSCLPKDLRALNYRARELDLCLPLFDAISNSNLQHLDRAAEMVLSAGKTKIALLGLSFKAATDDLRGSPQVALAKRLLGEGCQLKIWDKNVTLGRLIGSNRQYIEDVIPHIGSLLCSSVEDAVASAEVVIVATKDLELHQLSHQLMPEQMVVDLVNLEKSSRPAGHAGYEGLCW